MVTSGIAAALYSVWGFSFPSPPCRGGPLSILGCFGLEGEGVDAWRGACLSGRKEGKNSWLGYGIVLNLIIVRVVYLYETTKKKYLRENCYLWVPVHASIYVESKFNHLLSLR